MKHFISYIEDRYPVFESTAVAAYDYIMWLGENGYQIEQRPYGFITYKFEGDACILLDLFVNKDFRLSGHAWELFNWLRSEAQKKPECNVIITFSETMGKNQHLGLAAIKASGFIPYIQEETRTVFIRGNY